eukprot:Polyplicarium_translucidae@DN3563_c0_g1_i2.p1
MAGTRNSTAARSFAPLVYAGRLTKDEILISDGSKADLCRLQFLFGSDTSVAVQDPVYPVYVDGSVLAGKSGEYNFDTQQYRSIVYMRCLPEEKKQSAGSQSIFLHDSWSLGQRASTGSRATEKNK